MLTMTEPNGTKWYLAEDVDAEVARLRGALSEIMRTIGPAKGVDRRAMAARKAFMVAREALASDRDREGES